MSYKTSVAGDILMIIPLYFYLSRSMNTGLLLAMKYMNVLVPLYLSYRPEYFHYCSKLYLSATLKLTINAHLWTYLIITVNFILVAHSLHKLYSFFILKTHIFFTFCIVNSMIATFSISVSWLLHFTLHHSFPCRLTCILINTRNNK